MSHRRRKLTLLPAQVGPLGLPAADDPGLPGLVRLDRLSGRPQRWPAALRGPGLRTRHAVQTDVGQREEHNEDAYLAVPELGLFGVCDGVGGQVAGEVASSLAAQTIQEWVRREAPTLTAAGSSQGEVLVASMGVILRDAILDASQAIRDLARTDPQLVGMRTTASVVLISHGFAVVGQVGDSRVYLGRGGGVRQLTADHTLHNEMVEQGLRKPGPPRGRKSQITRTLGREEAVEVDIGAMPLVPGDRLLLCSDGLHDYLADDDLRALFQLEVRDAATAAIHHANMCGGADNITALFVELVAGA